MEWKYKESRSHRARASIIILYVDDFLREYKLEFNRILVYVLCVLHDDNVVNERNLTFIVDLTLFCYTILYYTYDGLCVLFTLMLLSPALLRFVQFRTHVNCV